MPHTLIPGNARASPAARDPHPEPTSTNEPVFAFFPENTL